MSVSSRTHARENGFRSAVTYCYCRRLIAGGAISATSTPDPRRPRTQLPTFSVRSETKSTRIACSNSQKSKSQFNVHSSQPICSRALRGQRRDVSLPRQFTSKVSEKCEQVPRARGSLRSLEPNVSEPKRPVVEGRSRTVCSKTRPAVLLKGKKTLANWDCAPRVDYVTIHLNGFERKLTGGEICNPYEDVVREVSPAARSFRLGYTIKTGRLFVISDDPQVNGQTITWGISGRDICRNNPDPDCLAARAVGPLPPGEYTFAADKSHRVNWGPKTKRSVARYLFKEALEQGLVQSSAHRRHLGPAEYCYSRPLERRDVGGVHWTGTKRLGLRLNSDQGHARDRS